MSGTFALSVIYSEWIPYNIRIDCFYDVQPSSKEYRDAVEMWDLYTDTKNLLFAEAFGDMSENQSTEVTYCVQNSLFILINNFVNHYINYLTSTQDDSSSVQADEDIDTQCEQLFAAVVTAREGDKDLSSPFKVLPSRLVRKQGIYDHAFIHVPFH